MVIFMTWLNNNNQNIYKMTKTLKEWVEQAKQPIYYGAALHAAGRCKGDAERDLGIKLGTLTQV